MCPTNDDPDYDNRRRVKRTTGIPRSFLTTVDKSVALAQSGGDDEAKRPAGIMVNADGDFVIARPDKASWEKYQAKAKSSATAKGETAADKELREKGLECPVDKKMFIEPMKTPCCGKTYCNDCITNALIESDFVCPACKAEGVLIDDLKPDDEMTEKIKEYLQEKDKEVSKSPSPAPKSPAADSTTKSKSPGPQVDGAESGTQKTDAAVKVSSPQSTAASDQATQSDGTGKSQETAVTDAGTTTPDTTQSSTTSKKRPADELLENPKIPKAPKAMQQKMEKEQQNTAGMPQFMNGPNAMNGMMGMPNMPNMPNMPMMPFSPMNMMGMGGMPNMGMPMGMPMMNPGMMGMPMGGGFPPMDNNMFHGMMPGMNGNMMGGGMNPPMNPAMNGGMNGSHMNGGGMMGQGMNGGGMNGYQRNRNFHNQGYNQGPGNHFNNQMGGGSEEDAYFRKPVNPHRHHNRQKRVRPSDYREL